MAAGDDSLSGQCHVDNPKWTTVGGRFDEWQWDVLDAVRAVADELDATPAQIALRWLVDQPRFTCVPIVGARTADQLADNVGAVNISLSTAQFDRVREAGGTEST